jgi:hypothetical protein
VNEELAEGLEYPVPGFLDATNTLSISPILILAYTFILVALGLLTYWMFRAMDHPRLVLTQTPDGPRARRSDVIKYAISMPFLILLWVNVIGMILMITRNELTIVQIVAWPYALVLAIRFLAFVVPGAAHELAKLVPLALIALLILSGDVRPLDDVFVIGTVIPTLDDYMLNWVLLLTFDFIMTAVWYWGYIRWWKPRRARTAVAESARSAPEGSG